MNVRQLHEPRACPDCGEPVAPHHPTCEGCGAIIPPVKTAAEPDLAQVEQLLRQRRAAH